MLQIWHTWEDRGHLLKENLIIETMCIWMFEIRIIWQNLQQKDDNVVLRHMIRKDQYCIPISHFQMMKVSIFIHLDLYIMYICSTCNLVQLRFQLQVVYCTFLETEYKIIWCPLIFSMSIKTGLPVSVLSGYWAASYFSNPPSWFFLITRGDNSHCYFW